MSVSLFSHSYCVCLVFFFSIVILLKRVVKHRQRPDIISTHNILRYSHNIRNLILFSNLCMTSFCSADCCSDTEFTLHHTAQKGALVIWLSLSKRLVSLNISPSIRISYFFSQMFGWMNDIVLSYNRKGSVNLT